MQTDSRQTEQPAEEVRDELREAYDTDDDEGEVDERGEGGEAGQPARV